MRDEQAHRLDWAVGVLRETPSLPEGFLDRFEEKLAAEPTRPTVLVSGGGVTSLRKPTWTRRLMAAVILLAALAALAWIRPRSQAVPGIGVMVVAASESTRSSPRLGSTTSLRKTVELVQDDSLETGVDGSLVMMVGAPGNEIKVASESRIKIGRSSDGPRGQTLQPELLLSAGAVFITETSARISVRTDHAVFSPVGTDYRVTSAANSTTLEVLDGAVNAKPSQGGSSIRVGPGEKLVVGSGAQWSALRPIEMSNRELEPLVRERRSFGKLQRKPSPGLELPSYPKAEKRVPRRPDFAAAAPTTRAGPGTPAATPARTARRPVRASARPTSTTPVARRTRARTSALNRPTTGTTPEPRVRSSRTEPSTRYPRARARRQTSNPGVPDHSRANPSPPASIQNRPTTAVRDRVDQRQDATNRPVRYPPTRVGSGTNRVRPTDRTGPLRNPRPTPEAIRERFLRARTTPGRPPSPRR